MEKTNDVDILVGMQYGDCGKGMVCKLLADRAEKKGLSYVWTGRVGAQNAEHRFIHEACTFCARIFPSAAAYRENILAILGAGHCFLPGHLFREAIHLGIPLSRVYVDPHAMWLRPEHAQANKETGDQRGTTGWGIGVALAEKLRRQPGTRLIGDCADIRQALGNRVASVPALLDMLKGPGLVEGSQGTMLSLNHGHYPFCTGKDVTAPAICAELGISHKRIRHVYGAARMVMMRVSGPSGPTGGKEITYDAVEKRTGLRLPQHRRLQGDSMRWRARGSTTEVEEERLFDISLDELQFAMALNGCDRLALTFADYHRQGNYRARRWKDLHPDTQDLVRLVHHEIAPVFLVRTGQGEHDNIWYEDGKPWRK